MTTVTKPEMTTAWGTTGSISTPTTAKQSQGWVSEIPPLEYFNWLDNRQDTYLQHIDQGGVPEWDATVSYVANYSYTKRNGVVYGCIVSNTGSDPSTTPSDWVAMPSPTTAGHLVTARNILDDGNGNTTVASLTSTNGVTLGSSTDSVYLYDGGSNSFAVRVGPSTSYSYFTVRGSDGSVMVGGGGLPVLPATASNHAVQMGQLSNGSLTALNTAHNTLDDGSGGMTTAAGATINGVVAVAQNQANNTGASLAFDPTGFYIEAVINGTSANKLHMSGSGNTQLAEFDINAALTACNGVLSLSGATPTVASGQIGIGASTSTTATAGGGASLPATVAGFLEVNLGGTMVKVPYYSV